MTTTELNYDIQHCDVLSRLLVLACHGVCYDSDTKRSIRITPYAGAYGIAGYVCTLEGTPPPATVIVLSDNHGETADSLVIIKTTGARRVYTEGYGKGYANKKLNELAVYVMTHVAKVEGRNVAQAMQQFR
jgi:hypothetical protein